ncbi:hypothetical protein GCM10007377_13600 [Galliscardovia ingluviei]|uniref:Uncharacterized protein n=1 Tax=Galliscardovia ingluviei TaxID=1769422 RepID=A0A8J3EXF4_9BIFI|nr:hypothetical protein GCM10007377_13600 [Galliscardovia ingluviei]
MKNITLVRVSFVLHWKFSVYSDDLDRELDIRFFAQIFGQSFAHCPHFFRFGYPVPRVPNPRAPNGEHGLLC